MSIPKILYKYLDPNGAEKTIEEQTLKYTPPDMFNDPFELLPAGFLDLNQSFFLKAARDELLNSQDLQKRYRTHEYSSDELWRKYIYSTECPCVKKLAEIVKDNFLSPDVAQKYQERFSRSFAISCFSQSKDNILMWTHYARQHEGIVIGFETQLLSGKILEVNYSDSRAFIYNEWDRQPKSIQDEIILGLLTTKSTQWSYESEWRMIANINDLHNKSDIFVQSFNPDAIVEIILGCRANALEEKIKKKLQKYKNAKLFEAKIHPSDFKIEIFEC